MDIQQTLHWAAGIMKLEADNCFLAISAFDMDISLFEWLMPLMIDARFVLLDDASASDPQRVISTLWSFRVTVIQVSPCIWMQLIRSENPFPKHLVHILVTGEPASSLLLERMATCSATTWCLPTIPEAPLWFLAKHLNQTSAFWIEHPAPITAGGYRKNQRSNSKGSTQIGTRRISYKAIETVLEQHESILEAGVMTVKQQFSGTLILRAYVVHASGLPNKTAKQIRSYLAQELPVWMIPREIYFTQDLPHKDGTTRDRTELARKSDHYFTIDEDDAEDEERKRLKLLFCRILDIDSIGIAESFFDLGGNSILAASLLLAINTEFQCQITLNALLASPPTVESIESLLGKSVPKEARTLTTGQIKGGDNGE